MTNVVCRNGILFLLGPRPAFLLTLVATFFAASFAAAQLRPWPPPQSAISLLSVKGVIEEMALSTEQSTQAKKLTDQILGSRVARLQIALEAKLSKEEEERKAKEIEEKENREIEAFLKTLSANQATRLSELYVQRRGLFALLDKDIQELLRLTPKQVHRTVEVTKDHEQATNAAQEHSFKALGITMQTYWEVQQGRKIDTAERERESERLTKQAENEQKRADEEAHSKLKSVLTEEQTATFEKMKGKPFAFP